jgi:signal transduction histidine kinase
VALAHGLPLSMSITTAAVIIGLGAAYFAFTEFLLYRTKASLLVGLAFLLLAESNAGTGILPSLAGWHDRLELADLESGVQRLVAAAILVVAGLQVRNTVSRRGPRRWTAIGIASVTAVSGAAALFLLLLPPVNPADVLQRSSQLIAGLLFLMASALFWRTGKATSRPWFIWLSLNFCIGGFAQLLYVSRPYAPSVVEEGDVLRLVFFVGIVLGLIGEWSRAFRVLRSQTHELEVLHALVTAPNIRNTEDVSRHIEGIVGGALAASAELTVIPASAHEEVEQHRPEEPDSLVVVRSGDRGAGARTLAVTLEARGRQLGTLVVARMANEGFTANDERLLRAFAAQASVLLDRSLLYEEVAAGAVLAERSRLAREIHDGLAQHLAFLKMRVAWLKRAPATVDSGELEDIEGVLGTALAEARQAITTLRSGPEAATAVEAIAGYAEEFGRVSGLTVSVEREPELPDVGPRSRVELLRIIQEALNNVRKHARADCVRVTLGRELDGLVVRVIDDGSGFNPAEEKEGHFGTEIMRERAESIGGALTITSSPGSGTDVSIWVPAYGDEVPQQRELG